MKIKKCICDLCGKETEHPLSIHHQFEYGSKYDGMMLDVDLCQKCADMLAAELEIKKIYPIIKEEVA